MFFADCCSRVKVVCVTGRQQLGWWTHEHDWAAVPSSSWPDCHTRVSTVTHVSALSDTCQHCHLCFFLSFFVCCRMRLLCSILLHCVSKKVPTFKLSITLSHLNRFSKFSLLENAWNLLQKLCDTTRLALDMLLHYLGKLKIQIFCRYSAVVEENANKLHFYWL